uniref:Uncharacterized protein n=1 Tax=Oryza punctata TaxID=4537 RepID=A0A0E0K134_ORYPU
SPCSGCVRCKTTRESKILKKPSIAAATKSLSKPPLPYCCCRYYYYLHQPSAAVADGGPHCFGKPLIDVAL